MSAWNTTGLGRDPDARARRWTLAHLNTPHPDEEGVRPSEEERREQILARARVEFDELVGRAREAKAAGNRDEEKELRRLAADVAKTWKGERARGWGS